MKSTSVPNTIASNRMLAEKIPYPLHLGVTEAGTKWSGSLKSAVGLGTLLADGIGDTIRISLSTFHAEEEVKVAWEILKALKLRERGPDLIACPTCGRLQFDMDSVVAEVERRLEAYEDPIEVSVLGCAVNGIGEARHADFGITGAKDMGMIYSKGEPLKKVPTEQLVEELFKEIDRYYAAGKTVQRDEAAAADAREWLAENEDATAMTPERIAALEAAAAQEDAKRGRRCSNRCSRHPAPSLPPRLDEPSRPSPGGASPAAEPDRGSQATSALVRICSKLSRCRGGCAHQVVRAAGVWAQIHARDALSSRSAWARSSSHGVVEEDLIARRADVARRRRGPRARRSSGGRGADRGSAAPRTGPSDRRASARAPRAR